MNSGVLYFQRVEQHKRGLYDGVIGLLIATEYLQRVVLEHCHDKPGAGHMG